MSNLEKLATYLESGQLRAEFNMGLYSADGEFAVSCGTAGCAVGHGPYAGIPKSEFETWQEYAFRVFDLTSEQYDYCFNSYWKEYDNTPEGAAKRIRRVLAGAEMHLPWEGLYGY